MKQTILQLDPNPQAQFYFQLISKSPNPNSEIITSNKGDYGRSSEFEEDSEEVSEDLEDEPEDPILGNSEKVPKRRSRLTPNQAKKYFTQFLKAKKIEAGIILMH